MRRSDRKITNTAEIESLIRTSPLCHLAMIDNGKPYVVPMNFGFFNGALYFHSAPQGRKIDVLRKNPEVCFSIVDKYGLVTGEKACSWTASYRSVSGTGKAVIIIDREEKEKGLKILMARYSDKVYNFTEEDLFGVVVIRVDIEEMTGKSSDTETRRPGDTEM